MLRKYLAILVTSFLLVASPVFGGETKVIQPGEVVEIPGLFIPEEPARRLATDIRDRQDLLELILALRDELLAKDAELGARIAEITELHKQIQSNEVAVAVSKEINKIRVDQLDRYEKTLERAIARIDSLEQRLTMSQFLGVLGPIGMLLLMFIL